MLFCQRDNSGYFQTWSYFSKFCHNNIQSSLNEVLPFSNQSGAKANLILVLAFTLQTSAKYLNPIKHRCGRTQKNGSQVENNCLLNPVWIYDSMPGPWTAVSVCVLSMNEPLLELISQSKHCAEYIKVDALWTLTSLSLPTITSSDSSSSRSSRELLRAELQHGERGPPTARPGLSTASVKHSAIR